MIEYNDLLTVPYKPRGRDSKGMDCYGLVIECCKRNGTPLADLFREIDSIDKDEAERYIEKGLNVKKIDAPKVGCIVEMFSGNKVHVGFLVERDKVLHSIIGKGVRISPLGVFKPVYFYEVI